VGDARCRGAGADHRPFALQFGPHADRRRSRCPGDRIGSLAARIRNAGSVFVGPWAPESAGDYATGANHVLPTGGLARGCGPLAVETFGKYLQVQRISRDGLARLRPTITTLAAAEGLFAHRDAVEVRFAGDDPAPGEIRDSESTEARR
jgi:hypothetical protein